MISTSICYAVDELLPFMKQLCGTPVWIEAVRLLLPEAWCQGTHHDIASLQSLLRYLNHDSMLSRSTTRQILYYFSLCKVCTVLTLDLLLIDMLHSSHILALYFPALLLCITRRGVACTGGARMCLASCVVW